MLRLPVGTVTFVFTDIEGSTQLLRRAGNRYAGLLEEQRGILQTACGEHGGCTVEIQGDSCFFAFPSARQAVSAVVAAQRALAEHPWPEGARVLIRMGVHTGEAENVGGGYVGMDIHRAARVAGVAHGGQVVLSEATYGLVVDDLPDQVTLLDLGEHRLKDLTRAQRLYQLVVPGLSHEFPPLRSLAAVPNNLPVQLTSFVGRERERAAVRRLLASARLLTLTGVGGAGKTRLALQSAAEASETFPHGVWVVELATLADPLLVPKAVASVLGVREQAGRSLAEALADFLRARTLLLVFDNCEHLLDGCAQLVQHLLQASPGLRVLATSRELLGVPGEVLCAVPPLSLPSDDGPPGSTAPDTYEAVALFLDRARAVVPGFALTPDTLRPVLQICRRLDGIPLAIELAAAMVRVMSAIDIAARLDDRLRLLTSGGRTTLPRHQTLRAALDWSHELLSEREAALLRRASVFAGFTLEAAESVCASAPIDPSDVVDLVARTVDKSLTLVVTSGEHSRYRLLETVRVYYQERLVEAGEQERVQEAHFDHYLGLVQAEEQQANTARPGRRGDRLEREHDNIRLALAWGVKVRPLGALTMATSLWRFWAARGHLAEGRRWLDRALDVAAAPPSSVWAEALLGAGRLAALRGDYDEARGLISRSKEVAARDGDMLRVASAVEHLGNVSQRIGDHGGARRFFEEALRLFRAEGDLEGVGRVLSDLGHGLWHEGERELARSYCDEGLAVSRSSPQRSWLTEILWTLGLIARDEGDYRSARARFAEALSILWERRDRSYTAHLLEAFAGLAALEGDGVRAARLLGAAEALREAIQYPLPDSHRNDVEEPVVLVRASLPGPALEAAWAEGRDMGPERAVAYALDWR